jgi:hypothetical protein
MPKLRPLPPDAGGLAPGPGRSELPPWERWPLPGPAALAGVGRAAAPPAMPLPPGLVAARALTARVSAGLVAAGAAAAGLCGDGAPALDAVGRKGLELDGRGLDGPGVDGLDVLAPDGPAAGGVRSDALGPDRPAPEAPDAASPRCSGSSRPRRAEPLPRLLLLRAMADPLGLVDVRRSEDGMRWRSDVPPMDSPSIFDRPLQAARRARSGRAAPRSAPAARRACDRTRRPRR